MTTMHYVPFVAVMSNLSYIESSYKTFFSSETSCLNYLLSEKNDPGIPNKLCHPKTFQSLTIKTERFRKTFILHCLRHYQSCCTTVAVIDVYWNVPAVMHYNSFVAEHCTIFSYALYVVCMYFVSLIQLFLPNQINHYYVIVHGS